MAQADAEAATFEAIARQWHEKVRGRWNADHVVKILAGLEREIFPHIGQLPISQIKPQMVLAALKPILDRNAVDRAHRTLRFVCSVFEHGMDYAKRTSFNHPLIIMVGFATAWLAVTGFWLSVPHNVAA